MRRFTTFARGSSVPAATLNSMQDNAVGLRRGSGAVANGGPGYLGEDGVTWCTGGSGLADGAAAVVDASCDWRACSVNAIFVRLSAADQRAQGAAAWKRNSPDPTHGIAVRRIDDAVTGTGCAASDGVPTISSGHFGIILDELATGADRVFLFADSENDGALTLYNDSGATLHAELKAWGSGESAQGEGTSTVPGFNTGDVDTTDATWTTIVTLSPSTSTGLTLRGSVAAIRDDGTEAGGWDFTVRVRRGSSGNPVTGTAFFALAEHDGTGWDVRVQTSGATVVVQVLGEAATNITWRAEVAATEARPS